MRLRALLLCLALVALGGCNDDGGDPAGRPSPSASTTADPFDALAPPTSPGVGGFDGVFVNRAYDAARGLLALQLLEEPTLQGTGDAALATELTGALKGQDVAARLRGRAGLDLRPRFPQGTVLSHPVGEVIRSGYTAEEVRGLEGEQGLRVTWKGTVRYPVRVGSDAGEVTYDLTTGYVFGEVAGEPGGLALQVLVPGKATVEGAIDACLAKGVLYPGAAGAACPV